MLIYDSHYKFIGIDEEDLKALGFFNIQELLSEVQDVADFFVKKPGYIYNFKNMPWILNVMHNESGNKKVIIHTSKKQFSCDIHITPFHLASSPEEAAYAVLLQHIHSLSSDETAAIATAGTTSAPETAPAYTPPSQPEPAVTTPSPQPEETTEPATFEPPVSDTFESTEEPTQETAFAPLDINLDEEDSFVKPLEIDEDLYTEDVKQEPMTAEPEPILPEVTPEPVAAPAVTPKTAPAAPSAGFTAEEQAFIDKLEVPSNYVFDPSIAADELGLPVDLIEEFIGDFIKQAHEFHDELFTSATRADFDNVKILSHKLKGVAANLRVEDALEMLTLINNSRDQIEVEAYLKSFYRVVDKLEGKEVPEVAAAAAPTAVEPEPSPQSGDDLYDLGLPAMEEAVPAEPEMAEVEEDLYTLDEKTPAAEDADDLYALDIAAPSPETEDDLYALDIAAPAEEEAETSADSVEDDLYALEITPAVDEIESSVAPTEEEDTLPQIDLPETGTDAIPGTEPSESVAPAPVMPTLQYDANKAAGELGLPFELIQELQREFVSDVQTMRSDFDNAISSNDVQSWQSSASELKGAADNLRMIQIADTLNTLSHTLDQQEAETSVQTLYNFIEQL